MSSPQFASLFRRAGSAAQEPKQTDTNQPSTQFASLFRRAGSAAGKPKAPMQNSTNKLSGIGSSGADTASDVNFNKVPDSLQFSSLFRQATNPGRQLDFTAR